MTASGAPASAQATPSTSSHRTILVTGAMGCIGAWVLHHAVRAGHEVVAFDMSERRDRVQAVMDPGAWDAVRFVRGDLTDRAQVDAVLRDHGVDAVVHLAALQVPFCKADPALGARVNVEGTVHVFQAAAAHGVGHLAYASSIAVYGPRDAYHVDLVHDGLPKMPGTFYGVTKVANESTARLAWSDQGTSSIALRPYTVYGVGRDQGLTSEPTVAMAAAARGEDAHLSFGGRMQFQWASDVAQQFLDAALTPVPGAHVFDLGGPVTDVREVAAIVEELVPGVRVTIGDGRLPFPDGFDDRPLRAGVPTVHETPLRDGIAATIRRFRELAARA